MNNDPTQQPNQAPLVPINTQKLARNGWIFLGIGAVVTIVGLILGYALVAGAILFAIAGRLGLQSKNKALSIAGITLAVLSVAFFIFVSATTPR